MKRIIAPPAPEAPAADRRAPHPLYRAGDIEVTEIAEQASDVRFALWDDGTLTITDGDDILQYGPDVPRRLALLLGVPGTSNVSNLGA